MVIDINFKGQDYSPLDKATIEIIPKETSSEDESLKSLINTKKTFLLEKFLMEIDPKDLLVNDSKKGKNSGSNNELYSDFNGGYFCGIVGVVKKKIRISKSELEGNDQASPASINMEAGNQDNPDYIEMNIKLQLQSRLENDLVNNQPGKPYFLSTMLLKDNIKLNENMVPGNEEELYDYLLLFWFKNQLQNAFLKGFYRTYRRFEKNDDRLKGTIDIARHLRLNMGQNTGKVAYSYRENTIDNYLNHIIVAAYDHLKKKYYDLVAENFDNNMELKSIIENLRREIGYSTYNSHRLLAKNLKPISHPFYTEYEELRKTCMKILRNEGISMFDGSTENETKGILFYLPDLWEEYLKDKIGDIDIISNGQNDYQKKSKFQTEAQKKVMIFGYKKKESERYEEKKKKCYDFKQMTRPDYIFSLENKGPFMILDAKFKPKWEDTVCGMHSLGSDSVNGVLADYDKCIRDMVSLGAHASGVIFPTNKRDRDIVKEYIVHPVSSYNKWDRFYTLPVSVPYTSTDKTYTSWKYDFDKNLEKSLQWLAEIIGIESSFYQDCNKVNTMLKDIGSKRKETDKRLFESLK